MEATAKPAPATAAAAETPKPAAAASNAAGYVKVDTIKLDALIDLVGELVISRIHGRAGSGALKSASRNLARNLAAAPPHHQ